MDDQSLVPNRGTFAPFLHQSVTFSGFHCFHFHPVLFLSFPIKPPQTYVLDFLGGVIIIWYVRAMCPTKAGQPEGCFNLRFIHKSCKRCAAPAQVHSMCCVGQQSKDEQNERRESTWRLWRPSSVLRS